MKTEKKRSFRGAVLLTVVSVMSLLIVFLTSTLVLATAANNRAHKSYSSSQASYTARAAIDSILAAAKQNEDFAIAMNSLKDGGSFDVDVNMESSATGIGKVDSAKIAYAGKKQFYDASKQEWVERDMISVTADVTSGGETKTVTAYVLKDPPAPGGGGGGGGGFVTVGTAGTANHTISFGGTYLGIGMSKGSRYYQGDYHLPGGQIVSLNDKLYLNRKDDQPGAIGDLGDGTIGYLPNMPETSDADNIVTYSFGNDGAVEAPVVINGNFYSNVTTEIYFPDISTGMSVWGNLTFQNLDKFTLKGNPDIVPTKFNEIPYIYIDSLFNANGGGGDMKLNADGAFPLNIFCGSANIVKAAIGADIYCQDSNKTSVLSGDAATSLYKWSDSVINKSSYLDSTMSGNFYSKGSAIVKDTNNWVTINGDMVIEGDLEVTGKLKVTGSLVVGGTLKCDGELDVAGNIDANFAYGSKITSDGTKKMTADGTQELYERQETDSYAVLAENVMLRTGPNPWDIEMKRFVWLKPEAIDAFGMPDSDGDGIIDGNVYDFHWSEIDKASFYFADEWNVGYEPWKADPNTATKVYATTVQWVNRDDPTDVTTNEMDTYEPGGTFKYNGSKDIASPDLYKAMHNNELFPRKAEKAVILGLEEIGDGTPMAESKVLKTVDEIEDEYNFSTKSITVIPSEGNYLADVNANVYTNGTLPAEITTSCTLSGYFTNKIIIKNTATNDIWVKLDNFTLGHGCELIYDDSTSNCGNLNLYVENEAKLLGSKIYPKSYKDLIDSNAKFQIATKKKLYVDDATGGTRVSCPKINIYSKQIEYNIVDGSVVSQPKFSMENMAFVAAAIEAPNMSFSLVDVAELNNTIHYNGRDISTAPGNNKRIGVIGILNVAEGGMTNNWVFLYTPRDLPDGPDKTGPDTVSKEFDVMYYEGF